MSYTAPGLAATLAALVLLVVAGAGLLRPASAQQSAHSEPMSTPWVQANDSAFGLGDAIYSSEDAFEVLVFDGQLYVGMEADNNLGARLWRTRRGVTRATGQDDWEEIAADAEGLPFGSSNLAQHDHIDSLAAFQGRLYASTANRSGTASGTLVYRASASEPITWTAVITPGFGDAYNINFKDMQVFEGQLCGGTHNAQAGAQVWCSPDGDIWNQVNRSGFGDPANRGIWSAHIFDGALYVGVNYTEGDATAGRLYRTDSLTDPLAWTEVYSDTDGSIMIDLLDELDGYLYVASRSSRGIMVLRSASGDAGSWEQVSVKGLDEHNERINENAGTITDGATVYNGRLYVAVFRLSLAGGVEVWCTSGTPQADNLVDWQQVGSDGLGDADNVFASLATFHGHVYAWTTNYESGQQVRRAFYPVYLPMIHPGMP
jgi:hypothetical protein